MVPVPIPAIPHPPSLRGAFLAAALLRLLASDGQAGGEMRSNYLKNTEPFRSLGEGRLWPMPVRKLQCFGSRLAEFIPHRVCSGAGLGDQIIRNLGRKFELAVLILGKEKFCIKNFSKTGTGNDFRFHL